MRYLDRCSQLQQLGSAPVLAICLSAGIKQNMCTAEVLSHATLLL